MAEKDRSRKSNSIQLFFRETAGELRKVSWPTWPEARRSARDDLSMREALQRVVLIVGHFVFALHRVAGALCHVVAPRGLRRVWPLECVRGVRPRR